MIALLRVRFRDETTTGTMVRRVLTAIAGLVVVAAVLFGGATLLRKTSLFFPYAYPQGFWNMDQLVPVPEDVWFETDDGVRLHGWLFRARPEKGAIVWSHGNAGNLTFRADAAAELARAGLTTLVYDYRGFGRSDGTPSESALYLDSIAAYDTFAKLTDAPIAVYGESIGGAYAAWIAANRPVCAVILDSSFASLREAARAIYAPLRVDLLTWEGLRTAEWSRDSGSPVLVMHSRSDTILPFALGEQLQQRIGTSASLSVFEASGHGTLAWDEREKWMYEVTRFVEANCGADR
ncbi:MAG: alpha/beta hydrolase [Acidobacteria bacterium]|nr:alpha/beta hydrolase [Acidobacteriota bacterium]